MNKQYIKLFLSILFFIFLIIGFVARIQHTNTHKEWFDGVVGVMVGMNIFILNILVMLEVPDKFRTGKPLPIVQAIFYLLFGAVLTSVSLIIFYQGISKVFSAF